MSHYNPAALYLFGMPKQVTVPVEALSMQAGDIYPLQAVTDTVCALAESWL